MIELPFGQYSPDAPDYKNTVKVANNVIPSTGGFAPFRGGGTTDGTASQTCRGARLAERSTGDVITVGGGSTALWVDVSGTVTETTGYTNIGSSAFWQFERFGQFVFATGPNNALQYLTAIDSATSWTAHPDPPSQATVLGKVGNYLMMGGLNGAPYSIQWSGLNDPLTFTPNATNLAGTAELDQDYGRVTGIVGDRYPMVFHEYGISRITIEGPPSVFRIDPIEEARGAIAPQSIVTAGFRTYFLAHDGFWLTNGTNQFPIGQNRVNETFLADVDQEQLGQVHGAVDWSNKSIVWSYIPKGSTGFTKQLIYSWEQDQWSTASLSLDYLVEGKAGSTTVDQLDAVYPGGVDNIPVSLDSPVLDAQNRVLSAYLPSSGSSVLTQLNGGTLEAQLDTGEHQAQVGKQTFICEVYPIIESMNGGSQAAIVTRSLSGGLETVSAAGALNAAGFCPVRAQGRYCRVRMTIPANDEWRKALGVQIEARPAGAR